MTGPRWRALAEQLAAEIRAGDREPGSRLPSLTELAAAGTSQTTALRAYQRLAELGLTVTVHGTGTYVADVIPDQDPTTQQRLAALEERVTALEQERARRGRIS